MKHDTSSTVTPSSLDLLDGGRPQSIGWLHLAAFVAFGSMLVGCMGQLGPKTAPPTTAGGHPVGVTTVKVSDAERDRELDVEIWYPAERATPQSSPTVYEVEAMGGAVARIRSPLRAHRNVASWRSGGRRPVVLVSHGAGSTRLAHVGLSEVLASHGYIVAAPDHDGHTVADKTWGISTEDRARSAYDRPLDLSSVLDHLERRSKSGDRLFGGLVDMDRVAIAGHSFGGRTALGLLGAAYDVERQRNECAEDDDDRRCRTVPVFEPRADSGRYRYHDPRVKAGVLIAPAGFEFYRADGVREVDAPALVVAARKDQTCPFETRHKPTFDALEGPKYMLDLKRAGHLTATDVCELVSSTGVLGEAFGGERATDGCGEAFISTDRALERVSEASLAFFDLHLNGVPRAEKRLQAALRPDDRRRSASFARE